MIKKIIATTLLLVSMQAQAFLVTDFDGNRIDTNDYVGDGRWTVVMIWALQCVPCEQQKPTVEAFHEKYKDSKAHVLGLVMDGHEYMPQIKEFVDKKPTKFPSHVVFGDVFSEQIMTETGKNFPISPGYLVYSPTGELKLALNGKININELVGYLESQFDS